MHLRLAAMAFAQLKTPTKIYAHTRNEGITALEDLFDSLDTEIQEHLTEQSDQLAAKDIKALFYTDDAYPSSLINNGKPLTPILFYWGNMQLLSRPSVGMCGSRSASPLGLKAAHACGQEVSERKLVVVSGYAKGVDTESHLAALESGGQTTIVLAEGFNYFKLKQAFRKHFDRERVVVISQFAPTQPWGAYAAMARNKVIYGLSKALVVVEAGERGGTLAAGEGALKEKKPLFVLNFGDDTPEGNKILLSKGGRSVKSRHELGEALNQDLSSTTQEVELKLY